MPRCQVGYLERPERIATLGVGLLVGNVRLALGLIAGFGLLTAAQRVAYAAWVTSHPDPTSLSPARRWGYWTQPRYSLPYWVVSGGLVAVLLIA